MPTEKDEQSQRLEIKLKKIESHYSTMIEIIERINFENNLHISVADITDTYPYNEEKERKNKFLVPSMPSVTLSEFLKIICKADKRFTYKVTDEVMVVYPKKWLSYDIMNVKIEEFKIENATYSEIIDKIFDLPQLGDSSDSSFFTMSKGAKLDTRISLNLKDITFFELFNKIADKTGGYWVSTGVTNVPSVGEHPPLRMLRNFRFEFD